jgi:hypothetical protein
MSEGAATRMKKFQNTEKSPVQCEVNLPKSRQIQSPDAVNFFTQDVKFSQEEMWMVEWETRNLQRSRE